MRRISEILAFSAHDRADHGKTGKAIALWMAVGSDPGFAASAKETILGDALVVDSRHAASLAYAADAFGDVDSFATGVSCRALAS